MNKTNTINLRLTEKELEHIDKKAEIAELKRSQYIRKIAIEGYIIKQDFSAVDKLVYEVNKIGNNINQIARRANEMEFVSLDDIKYLKNQLHNIYKQIEKFYDGG